MREKAIKAQEVLQLVQQFKSAETEREVRELHSQLRAKSRDVENNQDVVDDLRKQASASPFETSM